MTTGICLIGAGRIGRIHGSNIAALPRAALRYIVDVNEAAAASLAAELDSCVASIDKALADPEVKGVVVASSTDTHLDFIEAAAAAGKAIFCEKPLDLDIVRARRCMQAANASKVPLFVGFNRRYDPSFRRLRDEIAAGAIGNIEVISIVSRDPAPPPTDYIRRSGGLFRDMTIHDLDMARWLLGDEPVSVYASGSCLVDDSIAAADDIDTATLILRSDRGAFCQITNSRRCSYGYDQRIEVFGERGLLRADNDTATRVERAGPDGFLREPALPFFLERYAVAYRQQMQDFVAAIDGEPHALASGEDGLRALLLADAAERSRQADAPVALTE